MPVRAWLALGTLRLRIYTSVGVTSAIVFERDLIVVVQAAKNKAPGVAFQYVVVLTIQPADLGWDDAKIQIKSEIYPYFMFFLQKTFIYIG